MRVLVIPELREKQVTDMEMFRIQEGIQKIVKDVSVANLAAWSVFAPKGEKDESTMDLLTRGYFALSQNPTFMTYDVYIGFLLREDIEEVDAIIYSSEVAKEIYEARMNLDSLPKAKDTITISGEMSIENEIYKRTTDNYISEGE